MLYGLLSLPGIALLWVNNPLYGLILNGDDIADADFIPVSAGFCVACFLCFTAVWGVIIAGRRKIKLSNEASTAISIETPSEAAKETYSVL